jgi:hypothetical protein
MALLHNRRRSANNIRRYVWAGTTTVELDVLAKQPQHEQRQTPPAASWSFIRILRATLFFYPTVALQPDDTVDAPFLIINLNTYAGKWY